MPNDPPKPNRRYLKATLAGGAGGLLAVLIFLLEQRPELAQLLLERVVIAWGPQFVIVLLLFAFLYLLADRYAPRLIAAQSETALALQNLARAVEQLVARENAFQREQDVLLNHVARRVDALHQLLVAHLSRAKSRGHRRLNGHLASLSRWPRRRGAKPPSPEASGPRGVKANPRGLAKANGKRKLPRRAAAPARRAARRRPAASPAPSPRAGRPSAAPPPSSTPAAEPSQGA